MNPNIVEVISEKVTIEFEGFCRIVCVGIDSEGRTWKWFTDFVGTCNWDHSFHEI